MFVLPKSGLAVLLVCLVIASFSSVRGDQKSESEKAPAARVEKKAAAETAPKAEEKVRKKEAAKETAKNAAKEAPKKGDAKADAKPAPAEKDKKEEEEAKEEIHVVKESPFTVKTKLSGIVESIRQTPVAMDLKRWTDMTVVEAIPHGSEVKEGDLLIELDREALEKKIRETEVGMPLKELELQAAELELDKLEKSTPLTLESARRSKMQAEQDLAYFEDVTRPMRERSAKESLKSRGEYLAYAEEELKQLKKMYAADDMTEETEEIILRRAQNTVNEYRWQLEQSKVSTDRTLSTTLPREHESLQRSLELKQITWRAGEKSTRDALEKMRLEVKAKHREMEEAERQFEEYEKDLKQLNVTAPHSGIVYYGMNQRGKWTTGATIEKKLIPGGKLTMREIVMTVVDPSKLQLRVGVAEDKLTDLAPGQDASLSLKWNSETKISGKVQQVSHVPFADSTFDMVISMGAAGKGQTVTPGMSADAEVVVYEAKKAITIPKGTIKKEGEKETVTLQGGKVVTITTGRTEGDTVEVIKGLKAGDKVVVPAKPKPDAEKKETEKK